MTTAALLRLAWRESRTARRRLALYMSSIGFGVAALVAIDSFAGNVTRSIREQSRTLLGGDLALQARAPFPGVVDSLVDSLTQPVRPRDGRQGAIAAARVTTFASMAYAPSRGTTRLAQVRAVTPGYPFYGGIETVPASAWHEAHEAPTAFVDDGLLVALGVAVGDTLRLGEQTFRIAGTLGNVPGDAGITAVVGPRIYISARWLEATRLLRQGSRAEYGIVVRLPGALGTPAAARTLARTLRRSIDPKQAALEEAREARGERTEGPGGEGAEEEPPGDRATTEAAGTTGRDTTGAAARDTSGLLSGSVRTRVRVRTVEDTERDFTQAVARLADFLSIVGLIALLLGGIGVASGVHAFVSAKIDTVAVLRCLGATSRQVVALYVVQAAAMGLVGALAGAALGVAVQFLLPRALGEFLPIDVVLAIEPIPLLLGLATGVWVALIFSLRPLLALRRISPLQAIRRSADDAAIPSEWRDPVRLTVDGLLVASIVTIVISRMGSLRDGAITSAGIAGVVLVLWAAATACIALARRAPRATWPFTLRQGIANLHRPANQTRPVTLALGFGAFLLSTVYLVQANLLRQVEATEGASAGNLLFFDVQEDQAAPLDSLLAAGRHPVVQRTPIVTMRLDAINGRAATALQSDSSVRRAGWALRREYRSTYRDTLVPSERLLEGRWFDPADVRRERRAADPSRPYEVSVERDLARDLALSLGDTLTWNVQGVPVRTVVTSVRTVNWARFEANFFVVFEPEALRGAPQQFVLVATVTGKPAMAAVQRDVVRRFPNVSSLDLSLVRDTIGAIVTRVTMAIRFLGLFALAMGIPVLFSAVAATRRARLREGVLLRTLGASRAQVARVLLAEYGALGTLGALTGMGLAFGGAWALTRFVFDDPFDPAVGASLLIAGGMLLLTMTIGWLTSRDVYRETPMMAIRDQG